ncbi:MFS transporter [Secundilactobacillus kimchicus]|uniref:Multidrug resistance efflux pump n=1 Tax=Secundilactobacillus kimchicus JCM 15530 TaxID=1302272 RepID=A0A0R1HR02_9LACO|nr:MFS transporter [Secundilactobacillus kimchicus]KRK48888.1 multidrug resistance efflux pump [Secundilactobacillus kimchicus JCM 15530]MBT9671917.1 MFS transporter [Secundilactobacillus kimchicus]
MDDTQQEKSPWRRNLIVLWGCTFIAGIAFSEIMPFMSLYVSELGHFTKAEVSFYSGLVYAATFLVTAIVSPLWGALADRKGRKIMLIRASFGMAVAMFLMGLVSNVWQLLALRALQGLFSGFISNAQALIATQTPRDHSGQALGTLVTGSTSGMLMGPIIGGALAEVFSIRDTFFITAALLALAGVLSATLVKEYFTPVKRSNQSGKSGIGGLLAQFKSPRLIMVLLLSTMFVQLGNTSIAPIISLYVKQLMGNQGPIALVAGIIAALPGISNILAAPRLGAYGDSRGSGRVLMAGYLFAMLMYIPQGLVTSIWVLGFLRLMIGISDGALFPTIQTLLTKNSPISATSAIFSWNQSFQALGNMFGSLLGGSLAGLFGYNTVFISTACLLALNFLMLWFVEPSLRFKFNKAAK